jgi:hypothetical protein
VTDLRAEIEAVVERCQACLEEDRCGSCAERIDRLVSWAEPREAEVQRFREENETLRTMNDLRLRKAEAVDGALHLSLIDPTGASQVLAETFAGLLDKYKAENYVECQFIRPHDDQVYTVTVQRPEGKTPHQLRQAAEAEVQRLREELAELRSERDALLAPVLERALKGEGVSAPMTGEEFSEWLHRQARAQEER